MEERDVSYVIHAHSEQPRKPSKAFRKWDGKTPYFVHPLWCATMILAETTLDEALRKQGAIVLLYHDLLEDTTAEMPKWHGPIIKQLVEEMTFESSDAEMVEVWSRGRFIRLLKLYDKVNNLLDAKSWMKPEKYERYATYTRRLIEDVEQNFGQLNITTIARAITT